MNRFDERRPRFWRHERDRQDARRDEDYRFNRPEEESDRSAGDSGRQPLSGNAYGYEPASGRSGRERSSERNWGDRDWRDSTRYGQREPYNARGGAERARWGGPWNEPGNGPRRDLRSDPRNYPRNEEGSRYSESQYGVGRQRSRFDPYGSGREPEFGEGPFADTSESPGYFGSGYYGDGGTSYTGGYDHRERSRYPGSLGEDTLRSSRPRYGSGPKGYTRSDERIREDISERLMLADGIDSSEVSVAVKDGKVSLEGTVPTRSMKHAIEDLADYTAGVTDVENRIRVVREGQGAGPGMSQSMTQGPTQNAGSTSIQSASGVTPTSTVGKTRQ